MKRFALLFALPMLFGCVGALVPVVKIDEESSKRLAEEINVYTNEDLKKLEYHRIAPIEATSCMNKIWDSPASKEDATNQLKYKASAMGGNALSNLLCQGQEGTNLAKNCWSSVTCYAAAIKVVSGSESSKKNVVTSEKPLVSVSPQDFEKTIPKKVATKEDKLVDGYLDKIPANWPQMYYYETDDYRYWTICGEALNSQSEAIISSKNKADEIFYTEFPKSKFADLSYETTHMEINTLANKYKSWRIIRIPRANRN